MSNLNRNEVDESPESGGFVQPTTRLEEEGEGEEEQNELVDLEPANDGSAFHIEKHKDGGKYIKSMIYGGLDGIVSVFVTVAAVSGSDIGVGLVLILGLAKLIAGGFAMGVGDWLSTDAEVDMAKRERKREEWECDNFIEGEINEMVELYVSKGVPEETAREIMEIFAKNKKVFVDIMMAEELGIPADAVDEVPYKHGLVNFGSFMGFGVVPLLAYVVVVAADIKGDAVFYASIVITLLTLFAMGWIKGRMTGSSWIKSSITTVLLGSFTAFVGWLVTFVLNRAFPDVQID